MKTPATDSYPVLVKRVRQQLQDLDLLIRRSTAESYWNIGKFIDKHLLAHKQRADYGVAFYDRLARDVGRDATTLSRTVQFYRTYPILAERQELNWNHYKSLITIKDEAQRKKVEKETVRKGWDALKLKQYLSTKRALGIDSKEDAPIVRLPVARGRLNLCLAVEMIHPLTQRATLYLDPGFRLRYPFPSNGSLRLKKGAFVEIGAKAGKYTFVPATATVGECFTYQAQLKKVIDGDTLWAAIDTGLGILIEQKLRLRGIDCPEIDTAEGKRAKRFTQDRLKGLEWFIVKTWKDTTDKYDRYLADIFYAPGERDPQACAREGGFLNQELLDARLALEYKE